jgi:CheY-like chemotaxis protein
LYGDQSLRCNNYKKSLLGFSPFSFNYLTQITTGEILNKMGHKLLVADDSVTIQKVIKLALSSEGYEISVSSAGGGLISAIKQVRPDIVLIDVSLPDKNAYEIKAAVNKDPTLSSVKFILMYSAFEKIDEALAESLAFHGRLIKPFDPSNLRRIISDLLKSQTPASVPVQEESSVELAIEETASEELAEELLTVAPPPLPNVEPEPEPVAPVAAPAITTRSRITSLDLPPVTDMHPILEDSDADGNNEISTDFSLDLPLSEQLEDTGSISQMEVKVGIGDKTQFTEVYQPARNENNSAEVPSADDDIRDMTTSTIEQTGLGSDKELSFGGWSIDESKKLKVAPASKPLPLPLKDVDIGNSTFVDQLMHSQQKGSEPQRIQTKVGAEQSPSPLAQQMAGVIQQISGDLEELIKRDLEKSLQPTLEKVIRETIPIIAEALIKKEIDKLLSEES